MNYKFCPNSYDLNKISKLGLSNDEFLNLQIKYKNGIEEMLKKVFDFKTIDYNFKNVPQLDDFIYNFYHKYSNLGSKYVFLRNNIHIENLDLEEIEILKNVTDLKILQEFLLNSLPKVLFEDGNEVFVGVPNDRNLVKSKSFIFEFAYDDAECSVVESKAIILTINKIFLQLEKSIKEKWGLETSLVVNSGYDEELFLGNMEKNLTISDII